MRWFVEVNSIGKTEKQSFCVLADTWQRALQAARVLRGDNGPMTGFSIELLDDGFSAVDPMSRLRYFVKRAPDDAPLTETAQKAPRDDAQLGTPTVPKAVKSGPPRPTTSSHPSSHPASHAVPAAATVSSEPKARKEASKTFVFGSQGVANVAAPPVSVAPVAPLASDTSRDMLVGPSSARVPAASPARAPSPPRAPAAAMESAPRAEPVAHASAPPPANPAAIVTPPTVPGVQLLFKREQEPDNRTPLTYREYVYVVPQGTDELLANALLVAQFELVKAMLANSRPGRLVNLAMFDVSFSGKPPVPPLVTLTWKDWKGEAAIDFPRRKRNGPATNPPIGWTAPPPVAAQASQPPAPQASVVPAYPAAGYGTLPSAQPVVIPAPVAAAVPQQPAPAVPSPAVAPAPAAAPPAPFFPPPPPPPTFVAAPAPVQAVAPYPPPPPAPQPVAPYLAAPQAQPAPPPQPPLGSLTPSTGVRRGSSRPGLNVRLRGDELIADLFEVMHDLHFLRDAIEGADFCLTLALEKMPSRAGFVHLYDIDRREFVMVCVRGAGSGALLLRRHAENEPLLAAAMRKQRATVIANATTHDAAGAERYQAVGGAKSLVVAPVILAGRFLGAIELINPVDGAPFTDNEGHALSYIGEQYAEFVATRGVVLDPERIAAKSNPAHQ